MNAPPIEFVNQLNAVAPASYWFGQPHPPIENIMAALIRAFRSADTAQRRSAGNKLTTEAQHLLLDYAWERASEAIRRSSPDLVGDGLAALSIENGRVDARDSIVRMAILFRSAEKLGLDGALLFAEAADLALNPEFRDIVLAFPARPPEHRDLERAFFTVRETMTKDGFAYESQPWRMTRAIQRKVWWLRLRKMLGR